MQAVRTTGATRVSVESVATIVLVASLVMAGSNGIIASAVALPSYQIVLLRALIAAFLLGCMLLAAHKPLTALMYKREGLLVAAAGVALGADWLFLFEAYNYAGVGLSTILCYCAPIIVMALSPVVFHERFTFAKTAGFGIVVAGALLINISAVQAGASLYGIMCGLASAGCYAAMMMLSKKTDHVAGLEKVFIEIESAAAVVALYVVLFKGGFKGAVAGIGVSDLVPIALLGVSTALSNYLYLKSLGVLSAQSVAVLGYAEPLSAVALSAVILGETMLPVQVAGALCIIAGALVSEVKLSGHASPLPAVFRKVS